MDALDILRVRTKVGCVVDFVFEKLCGSISEIQVWAWKRRGETYDAGDFVAYKVRWLVFVVARQ